MYAVGRLGSYISRGVYTVSAPFHPFGGAVDIIVVEQPDGSFKSSPWYVRFGKFQGVLKSKEKVVRIRVNDADVNFHMYLDNNGEAHFLREVDGGDAASVLSPCSFGDETAEQSNSEKRQFKSKSCDYDGGSKLDSADQVGVVSNGNVVSRSTSRRGRIFGFVFGRRSMKEGSAKEEPVSPSVVRSSSLECAEIAADLLEVNWSTNTPTSMSEKDEASKVLENDDGRDGQTHDEQVMPGTSALDILENRVDHPVLPEHAVGEVSVQISCVSSMEDVGPSSSGGSFMEEEISYENAVGVIMEVKEETNQQIHYLEACPEKQFGTEEVDGKRDVLPGCGIGIRAETVLTTTGPLSEDIVVKQAEEMELDIEETSKIPESSTQTVSVGYMLGSVSKVVSPRVFSSSDSESQIQDEKSIENGFYPSLDSFCDSVTTKSFPPSDSSEEEQFLFSDLDNFKLKEQVCVNKDHQTSISTESKQINGSLDLNNQSQPHHPEDALIKLGISSDPISIQRSHSGKKDSLQHSSLPNMWSSGDESCMHDASLQRLSLDSNSEHLSRASRREKDSSCLKPYAAKELQSVEDKSNIGSESAFQPEGMIPVEKSSEGDQSKTINSSSRRWKIWPFSFKGSKRSEPISQEHAKVVASNGSVEESVGSQEGQEDDQAKQLANDSAKDLATENADDDENIHETKKVKRTVKATTPTSEQVASLNLKEGRNAATFTFSTEMLGEQQVDARIFLWKWNTRIVISDVDGTITKSDVLGQFMPMVGMDWSHTGVTHLFSAIKENGYELLFLSARSISQAYITRQFLVNLKQDGKALPDGPVVISPDGLFPSLFREVIRRAPHEFKIACLEVIKDLFPADSNPFPFYAGFGNRHTDEFSYLKVGIPKGKIFIINPKGEVAVHRRVDTKSYTSLHDLVHGIFPLRPSSEQEDFNSWNYWKLPPPEIK